MHVARRNNPNLLQGSSNRKRDVQEPASLRFAHRMKSWLGFAVPLIFDVQDRCARLCLHSPSADGASLDGPEDQVLNQQPKQDDRQETGEHVGDQELILVLENVPAQAA